MRNSTQPPSHPLRVYPSFRAIVRATPVFADLARATNEETLVHRLSFATADLATGFTMPAGCSERTAIHRRAWVTVRELDRSLLAIKLKRRVPAALIHKAQRAIDRADVMIGALPGVDTA